jgi:hypothetical protein
MNESLSRLLQDLSGEDPESRREVVLRLALVLEINAIDPASREANRADYAVNLLLDIIAIRGDDLTEAARFQAASAIERCAFQRDFDLSGELKRRLLDLVERRSSYASERVGEVLSYLEDDLWRAERHAS